MDLFLLWLNKGRPLRKFVLKHKRTLVSYKVLPCYFYRALICDGALGARQKK